ncbi:MAG: hypothetical protein AABY07_03670 [Nanoarchaeota archaeon]
MTIKDPRTKEQLNLCKRVSALLDKLRGRNDPRLSEIIDVLAEATKTKSSDIHYGQILYRGSIAVFSYVEGKYPDLYRLIQSVRKDLKSE